VRDRLSFRRFCGLQPEVETPDHASIWRFRQRIDKLGLSASLRVETNRQLEALGLIARRGTLMDATLIAAAAKRPSYGGGGVNPIDPDTRITMKNKKAHFGDNARLAVDEDSGLVRQAEMTPANVHDSRLGEALVQGDEQAVFATAPVTARPFARAPAGAGSATGSSGRSSIAAIRSRAGRNGSTAGWVRASSAPTPR
jgi:IS5 family transposase